MSSDSTETETRVAPARATFESFDDLPIAVLILVDGQVVRINDGWTHLTGRTWRDSYGQRWLEAVHDDDRLTATNTVDAAGGAEVATHDWRLMSPSGAEMWVHARIRHVVAGQKNMCVVTLNEIGARIAKEQQLLHLATHDPTTGLPNRRVFMAEVDEALRQAVVTAARVAVLFIDLDRFKEVNDRHGHECGDLLLVAVARRIHRAIRSTEMLARLGGDELAIVCRSLDTAEQVACLAARVVELVGAPFVIDERTIRIGASVGIAIGHAFAASGGRDTHSESDTAAGASAPDGLHESAGALLGRADRAMYQAKARGGGQWVLDGDHTVALVGAAGADTDAELQEFGVLLEDIERRATRIAHLSDARRPDLNRSANRIRQLLSEARTELDFASQPRPR